MTVAAASTRLLRHQRPGTHGVGGMELFFDLVYVFTIIQLSHYLIEHLSWSGAVEATILFAAVWWGWNYTAWAMNWLDPGHLAVRCLLAAVMLSALIMAVALPEAFGERAVVFAGAYVALQLVRSAFMVFAFRGSVMSRNYLQLLSWSAFAGVFWILGALGPDEHRLALWITAVVVDYAAPALRFWIPGLGASKLSTWPLDEAHLAERCRLVFIVALGESILVLGGTLLGVDWTALVIVAAVLGFSTIVLLWWLYFSSPHGNTEHEAPDAETATHVARGAYTYAHALMVAGAIVVAGSIELVVAHPWEAAGWSTVLPLVAGPVLYLVGNGIFAAFHTGRPPRSRVIPAVILLAAAPLLVPLKTILAAGLVFLVLLTLLLSSRPVEQHDLPAGRTPTS